MANYLSKDGLIRVLAKLDGIFERKGKLNALITHDQISTLDTNTTLLGALKSEYGSRTYFSARHFIAYENVPTYTDLPDFGFAPGGLRVDIQCGGTTGIVFLATTAAQADPAPPQFHMRQFRLWSTTPIWVGDWVNIADGGNPETGDSGKHQRIEDFEAYEDSGHWAIRSDTFKFVEDDLYAVHIGVANQGGQSEGVALFGIGVETTGVIQHSSGSAMHIDATIENGEIHFYGISSGQNGVNVDSIIRIGAFGGGIAQGQIFELERWTFWAASLTYVGWRKIDGESLDENVNYTIRGDYYGDPFEVTLENGYADLPNGYNVYIVNRSGIVHLEGGDVNSFHGIEIHSAAEPGAVMPPKENTDAMAAHWHSSVLRIEVNYSLYSMTGQERFELTFEDVQNSANTYLYSHLALDKRLFEPIDELFGFNPGDTYNDLEWMIREITQYCENYYLFDFDNVQDWNVYDYVNQLLETLNIIDMIDPKLMSLKMDFIYETENGMELRVMPIGISGTKGSNEVVVPIVRNKGSVS